MTYCFDIDGTICTMQEDHNYVNAQPFTDVVSKINDLYERGHTIILMTARGNGSGIDWQDITRKQVNEWGIKHHKLSVGKKPGADFYIDDKAINISDWRKALPKKVGLITGAFDIIHAGYIYMMEDAKTVCNYLIAALHEDPSLEREEKIKPSQSVKDRKCILQAIKYVDEVVTYKTEKDLENLLKSLSPDIRITGSDYKGKSFTGSHLNIPIYYHNRSHAKSSTALKQKISRSL